MRIVPDWRHLTMSVACIAVSWAVSAPSLAAMTGTVVLTPASVNASGIAVVPLTTATQTAQAQGIATVLDPQPLLALAANLQAMHARVLAADAAAKAAGAQAKRSQALYRQGENTSLRDMQAAQATATAAQAQRMMARAEQAAAHSGARSQWGPVLARLTARGPQALHDYADGHASLLEVVLPNGTRAPTGNSIQVWSTDGQRSTATLLSASPRADAVVQGPTFFYRTTAAGLRSGQRLSATVPLDSAVRQGVNVPTAAVIWYAGQPWVYVETAAGQFQRRPLDQVRDAQGWFQARGFHAGEKVVVRGGELLLSQEMQPPPGAAKPTGDGDDD
ncbi:MAG: efflux RND transporter periplasmic adaptor subunit [Rhodanobacter sp.]